METTLHKYYNSKLADVMMKDVVLPHSDVILLQLSVKPSQWLYFETDVRVVEYVMVEGFHKESMVVVL